MTWHRFAIDMTPMRRMGELDLPDRLAPEIPAWLTQIAVGVFCALAAGAIRVIFDAIAPGSAPFALVYPVIILATLLARWPAGTLAATIGILYAWRFVFPQQMRPVDVSGWRTLLVVSLSAALTIVIAELFRRAVRRAAMERDQEIADRDLFLAEFDHRMKNNFAIVAGLLDMQKRRADNPATVAALETAQLRVESIAQAHRHLYRGGVGGGERVNVVQMRDYLTELCTALGEALFLSGKVTLVCDSDEAAVPRDRAVSIGLIVNELVTNAAKHAFPGRDDGRISVTFRNRAGGGWSVVVADNGVGMTIGTTSPAHDRGLGTRLIDAFARQAEGRIDKISGPNGTAVTLEISG